MEESALMRGLRRWRMCADGGSPQMAALYTWGLCADGDSVKMGCVRRSGGRPAHVGSLRESIEREVAIMNHVVRRSVILEDGSLVSGGL